MECKQTANRPQLLSSKVIVKVGGRLSLKVSACKYHNDSERRGLVIEIKALFRLYIIEED